MSNPQTVICLSSPPPSTKKHCQPYDCASSEYQGLHGTTNEKFFKPWLSWPCQLHKHISSEVSLNYTFTQAKWKIHTVHYSLETPNLQRTIQFKSSTLANTGSGSRAAPPLSRPQPPLHPIDGFGFWTFSKLS